MKKFMVLIQPWAVGVKEREYFVQQGGLNQKWGRAWRPVSASSIEAARNKAKKMYRFENGKRVQYRELKVGEFPF